MKHHNAQLEEIIVTAIYNSLTLDYTLFKERMKMENFDTTTSLAHYLRDSYNTRLRDTLPQNVRWHSFKRGIWECRAIIDDRTKIVYSIIRKRSLQEIRNKFRKHEDGSPHYIVAMLKEMNSELTPQVEQGQLFSTDGNDWMLKSDDIIDSIFPNKDISDYNYCIIEFDSIGNLLTSIKCFTFDANFSIVNERNLADYISVNYNTVEMSSINNIANIDIENVERPKNVSLRDNALNINIITESNNSVEIKPKIE